MTFDECVVGITNDYIVDIRRRLHMHPEIGFDLPLTVHLIKAQLAEMQIPYTERFAKNSVVAYINGEKKGFTIGIRADMDALPINEGNDVTYRSTRQGFMHACGHDAHTAMLLGTARALKGMAAGIECRVALLFQPSEEGEESGARCMVENGVMDDIDVIIGLHVENWLDSGCIGVCVGPSMAASHPITVEFFGKTAHATLPHSGQDTLAMAVKTYNGIQTMLTREINPFDRYVCSIGALNAGVTHNVIPDYAQMKISLRTFEPALDHFITDKIETLAKNAAQELGGRANVKGETKALALINDPQISRLLLQSAERVVGPQRIVPMSVKMSSEDFSFYLAEKPGVFFRLGTRNLEKGIITLPHNNDFMIDEDALATGSQVCVRFVVDNMRGIAMCCT